MKNLLLLGTGGTIAGSASSATQTVGYRSGAVPLSTLVDAVPGLAALADIRSQQPFAIGSEHMTSGHWLRLAELARLALANDEVDAIVITHGTDTLEETAFFLDLMLPPGKPVVLTGAMRPATAVSADGPANLLAACRVACDPQAAGRGVLVAFNDCIWHAATLAKVHTVRIDAFAARDDRPAGIVASDAIHWYGLAQAEGGRRAASAFAGLALPASLPRVALVWQHVDCDESMVDWHLVRGARGIVLAGTGNGTMPAPMRAALAAASRQGCLVVRATRVAQGPVLRNTEPDPADSDDALGFITSGHLGPLKARLLLQCCLIAGLAPAAVQAQFDARR